MTTQTISRNEVTKFNQSFPKKYSQLKNKVSELSNLLFEEICKTGHFDSTRVRELKHIGVAWNLDRRGTPTGQATVRFYRQQPRIVTFHAAPPSQEELQDILDAHAN